MAAIAGDPLVRHSAPAGMTSLYPIAMTAPRASRGASLRMSDGEIATQPAVGVRPGRARWKKIALPRALGAPRIILVKHEGQVVEMVVAPHPVGAIDGGQAHGAIVTRARRLLAPALVAAHGLQRHAPGARSLTVGPVIAPQQPEPPGRCPPIALAFDPDNSRRSERAREAERARREPAARPVPGERPDAEEGEARRHIHDRSFGMTITMRDRSAASSVNLACAGPAHGRIFRRSRRFDRARATIRLTRALQSAAAPLRQAGSEA